MATRQGQLIIGAPADRPAAAAGMKQTFFLDETTSIFYRCDGSNWFAVPAAHHSLAITYISGTGTAGADNTAQTVKSIVVPANTLTQLGDRMRVRCYFAATVGPNITGTTKVGPAAAEVTVGSALINGTNLAVTEAWLHYIDNTHANIISMALGLLVTPPSAVNVAGFTWNAAQNVLISQDAIVAQHIVVYAVIVDVFPKGTI